MDSIEQYMYPGLAEACLMGLFDMSRESTMTQPLRCSETRRFCRVDGYFQVDLWVEGHLYPSVTHNVSYGGVFIETFRTFSEKQKVFICMHMNQTPGVFCVDGEVVRNSPHGVGIQLIRD